MCQALYSRCYEEQHTPNVQNLEPTIGTTAENSGEEGGYDDDEETSNTRFRHFAAESSQTSWHKLASTGQARREHCDSTHAGSAADKQPSVFGCVLEGKNENKADRLGSIDTIRSTFLNDVFVSFLQDSLTFLEFPYVCILPR